MKNKQLLITLAIILGVIAFFAIDILVYKNLLSSLPDAGTSMISETDGMTLLYVPAGEFLMGRTFTDEPQESKTERGRFIIQNEDPQHMVYLDAYWIDQTEVTQEMYAKCVDAGVCREPFRSVKDAENIPVTGISRDDAVQYCTWAGRTLPTEAQWEKAARGTDGRTYPWG